jgi:hypothetical protein
MTVESSLVHKTVFFLPSFSRLETAAPDTNILLLQIVAETDLSLLETFKRVRNFDSQDVDLLTVVLKPFQALITTPHVLAETSNFIDQAPQYRRTELVRAFERFIQKNDEHYEEARLLAKREQFPDLGLADMGLCSLGGRCTVITNDFQLSGKIEAMGGSVINFQQVRSQRIRP